MKKINKTKDVNTCKFNCCDLFYFCVDIIYIGKQKK